MSEIKLKLIADTSPKVLTEGDTFTPGQIGLVADSTTGALLVTGSTGGGGTGDASAENQTTQIALETAIRDRIGEVQASPTSNTLLARVKDLLTGITLAAGTNLIGKVGIDQTTPGTTDSVSVKSVGHTTTVSLTRPADTTAYTAGDAIGDTGGSAIFTFANMGKASGGDVIITSVEFEVDTDSSSIAGCNLRLYNAAPTAIADNAAWDLVSGDRGKYLGKIALSTPTDEGSTLFSDNDQINKQIKLTDSNLYVILQTTTGYTPAASIVHRITIHTLEV